MPVIAFIGVKSNVGNTTLCSALAETLARQGQQVLALDLCDDNALRLHLGMPWDASGGLLHCLAGNSDWRRATWRSPSGAFFLPFGDRRDHPGLPALPEREAWLPDGLDDLTTDPKRWVLIDAPPLPDPRGRQAMRVADLTLFTMAADPASHIRLMELHADATSWPDRGDAHASPRVVVNRFQMKSRLQTDLLTLLQDKFGGLCFPSGIPEDVRVAESLAKGCSITHYEPASPVCAQVSAMGLWLKRQMSPMLEENRA